MIYDDKFRIRMLDMSDLDFITSLRQDYSTNKQLGTFLFVSQESQRKWIESLAGDSENQYLILEVCDNNTWISIGLVRLTCIDFLNRSVCVGGDISREFRGKGYSKYLYRLVFSYCFDFLNMNRLWLLVLETNNIARDLYIKLGFKEEGIQRQAIYRYGKYLDYIQMSLLRSEIQFND